MIRIFYLFIFFCFKEPIKRRYIRNPNQQEFNEGKMLIFNGNDDQYNEKDFIPVEIKAGKNIFRDFIKKYESFYLI